MGMLIKDGTPIGGSSNNARDIKYDKTNSGLSAGNVQEAIDEVNSNLPEFTKITELGGRFANGWGQNGHNFYEKVNGINHLHLSIRNGVLTDGTYILQGEPFTTSHASIGALFGFNSDLILNGYYQVGAEGIRIYNVKDKNNLWGEIYWMD